MAQRRWTSTRARSSLREPSASTSRFAPPSKLAAQQLLGLAQQLVDAEPDVAARGLDHAVGVEQQRVAGPQHARRRRRTPRPSSRPSAGPSRLEHRPAARSRRASCGRRRVPGACAARSRRCAGRGRGGSRWRSPPPSPGAAGSRWRPGGSRPGGSAPSRPPNAPESSSARVPASLALAGHVDDGDLEPVGRRAAGPRRRSRRRTACRRPSAARTRRATPAAASGCRPGRGSGRAGRRASTRPARRRRRAGCAGTR